MHSAAFKLRIICLIAASIAVKGEELQLQGLASSGNPITIVRSGKHGDEPWLEFRSSDFSEPKRIAASSHYTKIGGEIVGLRATAIGLVINRPTTLEQTERIARSSALYVPWQLVFGGQAVWDENPTSTPRATIKKIAYTPEWTAISLTLARGAVGELRLNSSLKLTHVSLNGRDVPLFTQPRIVSEDDSTGISIHRALTTDGLQEIWYARKEPGSLGNMCLAKAFINGREVAWAGAEPVRWLVNGDHLIALSLLKGEEIQVGTFVQSEAHLEEAQERSINLPFDRLSMAISSDIIPFKKAAEEVARNELPKFTLRSAEISEGKLKAHLSCPANYDVSISFDPANHSAAVEVIDFSRPKDN